MSWEFKKLGEVTELQGGSQPPKSTFKYEEAEGYLRLLQIRDFKSDDRAVFIPKSKKNRLCYENDILIGRYGASVGKICTGKKGAYNVALMKATPDKELLNTRLYLYYLKSKLFQDELASVSSRSAQNGFSKDDIKDFIVPIPPLPVQKQIVETLDKAFEKIDKAIANIERNIENAEELLLSKQDSFFDKLSLDGSIQTKSLSNICLKIFAGGDKPKSFSKTKTLKQNIPVIANAVKNNGIYGYTETPVVKGKSVTVAARGSGTGHVEFRDYDYVPVVRLIVLIPDSDLINEKYLMTALTNLKVVSSGSAIPQLTVPMIKTYSIPVPDLEKQSEIVETIDILKNCIQSVLLIYQEKLENLENLKKSILEKAFKGELTSAA
jgi:type I restriction enzyme, S subunit